MCFCLSCHLDMPCSNENCTNDICPICENYPEEPQPYGGIGKAEYFERFTRALIRGLNGEHDQNR